MENSGNLLIVITKIVAHDFFHVFLGYCPGNVDVRLAIDGIIGEWHWMIIE